MFNKSIAHGKFALKSGISYFARPEEIVSAQLETNYSPTHKQRMKISSRTGQAHLIETWVGFNAGPFSE